MHNILNRKITTINKGQKVDKSNIQPGELIHMYFEFYNVTSICGFTFIITVVHAKTRIIWVLPTVSKRDPVRIIRFILTTLLNKQHPCIHVRVDQIVHWKNQHMSQTYILMNSKYPRKLVVGIYIG